MGAARVLRARGPPQPHLIVHCLPNDFNPLSRHARFDIARQEPPPPIRRLFEFALETLQTRMKVPHDPRRSSVQRQVRNIVQQQGRRRRSQQLRAIASKLVMIGAASDDYAPLDRQMA